MTFFQNISKKHSIFQWLILAILSLGIFAFQETGYHWRQKETNPVHHVESRTRNVSQVRSIYGFSANAQQSRGYQFKSKNQQSLVLNAFSKALDAFTVQGLIQFPAKITNIRTASFQHFLSRTFTSEDVFTIHS